MCVYLYHSAEHYRLQHPHRKELKSAITDDIIKLLNESVTPVEEGLFFLREMGLYNKTAHRARAHAEGCLLYHTHRSR